MSNEQNETVVRRTLALLCQPVLPSDRDQLIAPEWVASGPGPRIRGLKGFEELHDWFRNHFSDTQLTIHHLFSDGDYLGTHFTIHGRNTGDFMDNPATGKPVDLVSTAILRCRNGKVVESIVTPDRVGLLQQLGAMKGPGSERAQAA